MLSNLEDALRVLRLPSGLPTGGLVEEMNAFIDQLRAFQTEHGTQLISWQDMQDTQRIWERHIVDSLRALFALRFLAQQGGMEDGATLMLDVGCGSGMPSMPMYSYLKHCREEGAPWVWPRIAAWHLIDKNTKSMAFLRERTAKLAMHDVVLHVKPVDEYRMQNLQNFEATGKQGIRHVILMHRAYRKLDAIIKDLPNWVGFFDAQAKTPQNQSNNRVTLHFLLFLGRSSAQDANEVLREAGLSNIHKFDTQADGSCILLFSI